MLKQITNWSEFLAACKNAQGGPKKPYVCAECNHVWLGNAEKTPVRCSNHDCRALTNAPRYEERGRPPKED